MKIPTEDFTDETLAIDDTHGDDVRGGDKLKGASLKSSVGIFTHQGHISQVGSTVLLID